jgi:hypothetical protein
MTDDSTARKKRRLSVKSHSTLSGLALFIGFGAGGGLGFFLVDWLHPFLGSIGDAVFAFGSPVLGLIFANYLFDWIPAQCTECDGPAYRTAESNSFTAITTFVCRLCNYAQVVESEGHDGMV